MAGDIFQGFEVIMEVFVGGIDSDHESALVLALEDGFLSAEHGFMGIDL